ncbi:AAA family ATPase [Pontibacter sp. 13R65]|uniref:AAA family ATPase n=1 Tax=Pontibacter sp. 13R65 TaxID=3127458 RepID=UPI00301D039F
MNGNGYEQLQDLKKVIKKIRDLEAVNKFFDAAKHVLTRLGLTNEDGLVYAAALDSLQLTVGGKYVTNVSRKRGIVTLGFYIPTKYLDSFLQKYPDLGYNTEAVSQGSNIIWVSLEANKVQTEDFLEAITELAQQRTKEEKSPYRSQYGDKHNEWIIKAALEPKIRAFLFASTDSYYLVGAYWEGLTPENQTERFVNNSIWENGYDDKFLEDVSKVPVGSQIAIKSVFTREKTKPVMAIKARGTVTGNPKDGRKLEVQWEPDFKPFEVDFPGSYWATIKEVIKQEHIQAIWKDKPAETTPMNFPLNTIFYGPPGTGKTYTTLLRASQIIENREVEDYQEAQRIFNENLGDRIEFITFHQNYSYENFIQGLRPDTENGAELSFRKVDGVFKRIADRALNNLRLSEKAPEEVSRELLFEQALEKFIEKVQENEENFKINETAYISEVEEKAFRYTGDKWNKHANVLRMKFSDLREFDRNRVSSRQGVKKLKSISGLANQHATYYFLVYQQILKYIPQASEAPTKVKRQNYVIIIDEINRANISRVFGELITLIEPDKRSHGAIPLRCTLPSGEEFVVPSNLYIIGTMNTADKSIALLDIALRRRFEFEAMYPKYQLDGQQVYDTEVLEKINKKVVELKGHDFQIGHAYFMGENNNLVERMNKKVIPLLLEYFLNDEKEVSGILAHAGLEAEDNAWPLRIKGKRD